MKPQRTHRRKLMGLLSDLERLIQRMATIEKKDVGHLLADRQKLQRQLAQTRY